MAPRIRFAGASPSNGVRETLRHPNGTFHCKPMRCRGTARFDWIVRTNGTSAMPTSKFQREARSFSGFDLHVMGYHSGSRVFPARRFQAAHLHAPRATQLILLSYFLLQGDLGLLHGALSSADAFRRVYEVMIDSTLGDGSLTYGEYCHRGETGQEVLLSAHICHPSLANDNCSGLALLTCLAKHLAGRRTRYTYRFVFAPGTIGAIVWLSRNEHLASRIAHGLVVSCVGDRGGPTYRGVAGATVRSIVPWRMFSSCHADRQSRRLFTLRLR